MILLKGQIKAILQVLKKTRDRRLSNMSIQRINDEVRLILTDTYILASWKLKDCETLVGKIIPNLRIEHLYHFDALPKIDDAWVKANAEEDDIKNPYPIVTKLFQKQTTEIEKIAIDGNKLVSLQKMNGGSVWMYFTGESNQILCKSTDNEFLGLLLPIRGGIYK